MKRRALGLALVLIATTALAVPSGHKWFAVPPTYLVFLHSSINCPGCTYNPTIITAVKTSFARWTSANVSCTSWMSTYGGTYTTPAGTAGVAQDGTNHVLWVGGSAWSYSSATLGVTTTSWYQGSGEIFDADMELNNNVVWKLGGTTANYDVESIVTHEAGHFLGLDHTPQTQAVMTPYYNAGDIKRQLDTLDIQDVCGVYPAQTSAGAQGSACTTNTCATGLNCYGSSSSGSKICSKSCTTSTDCPSGYTCQNAVTSGGTSGKACLIPVGAPDLCTFCTDGSQCSSGICLTDGRHNWCTISCPNGASQCGSGYACQSGTSGAYCSPTNAACPTKQCTSNSQCAVGYACNSAGMCEATGNAGDRCEISGYCSNCSSCVGIDTEAYCRACCAGQGQGGECTSCPNAACAAGNQCTGLQNGSGQQLPDSVCIPGGAASCSTCASAADCQSGLTCYGGRCHPSCSPGGANTCYQKACLGTSASTGVCGCSDEIAYLGQPCGQTTNGLKVCANNSVCVGNPSVCRSPCTTAGSSAGCNTGETCTNVGGQNVCTPSQVAGTRCNPCNNGTCGSSDLSCFNGRCYKFCDTTNPVCGACVGVSGTAGVCSCDDEKQPPGGPCGLVANVPFSCSSGSVCVEPNPGQGGVCQLQCTVGGPLCPIGFTCEA
ncbi:MAG: matrixin family metalloprotease, partial [Myxococcaceae bacterium]